MTEEKNKALDYIEAIISSMRDCSFKCKEFCILICSAFLTIYATVEPSPNLMVILCAPVIAVFWVIDSCYLAKDRTFRKEYRRIVEMSAEEEKNNNPLLFSGKTCLLQYLKSMFWSFSTAPIYGLLEIASVVFGVILLKQ